MMENKATFIASLEDVLPTFEDGGGEAFASLIQNPRVNWIKFTLTDDQPNANKQRIPAEEFQNLINSGVYMPVKKAFGKIEKGHENSAPMGVITHLRTVENKVKGIAALWNKERPEDVDQIKAVMDTGKPINLSWELSYATAEAAEDGVTTLRDVVLTAATIVGLPAYGGRTSIEAFASEEKDDNAIEKERVKMAEAEEKLTKELEALKLQLDEQKKAVVLRDAELDTLRKFKEESERIANEQKKLAAIKQKFSILKKDEKFFEDNKEKLLSLDEATLEFVLQDTAIFKTPALEKKEDKKIPPITGNVDTIDLNPKSLGEALRESFKSN